MFASMSAPIINPIHGFIHVYDGAVIIFDGGILSICGQTRMMGYDKTKPARTFWKQWQP